MEDSQVTVTAIARQINTFTTQGIVVRSSGVSGLASQSPVSTAAQAASASPTQYIVPTLDGLLLQITPQGTITPLADLNRASLGVPFGIALDGPAVIATVSGFLGDHHLVRITGEGTIQPIADLSELCGTYGGPFGVAVRPGSSEYWVTLSSDTTASLGTLLRVSAKGQITSVADLSPYGIPFGIVASPQSQGWPDGFIVAQQKGWLTRVSAAGQVEPWINLGAQGLGTPFNLAVWGDLLVATTNQGFVVQVDRTGKMAKPLTDLKAQKFGIPSGIGVSGNDLIVSTNGGYLLRVQGASKP
jgi:hypothetical protein